VTLCIQIEWLFYNAFWCETVTRKWRWLHPGHGAPRVRRTKTRKWQTADQRKRLPKRLTVLVKPDMCLPNSWPIKYHRTWTRELAVSYPSTIIHVGGGRSSPRNFWCFWYDELLKLPSEHLWQTVPHRSRHPCCVERGFSVCAPTKVPPGRLSSPWPFHLVAALCLT